MGPGLTKPTPAARIFVINLDEDEARLVTIDREFARLGLSYERFSAFRGTAVPASLQSQFFDPAGRPYSAMTSGEIGCYASHLGVMAKVIEEKIDGPVLVLEDDVTLDDELVAVLANLHRLPSDWEIVRSTNPPRSPFVSAGHLTPVTEVVRYWRVPMGATAYLINNKGARRFLEGAPRRVRPLDTDLRRFWAFRLKTYGLLPLPVHWSHNASAIDRFGERPRGRPRFERDRAKVAPLAARLREFGLLTSMRCIAADLKAAVLQLFGVRRRYSPSLRVGSRADFRGRALPDTK